MPVSLLLAISRHDGKRMGEVGFLLLLIAGVLLALVPLVRSRVSLSQLAGVALAVGGLLLVIASHWGKFG